MKKRIKNISILLICLLVVIGSCTTGGIIGGDNNSGGEGADFDASLYYTKTEVDTMIANVSPLSGAGDPQWLSNSLGWSNRTTGWAVPEGANMVLIKVRIMTPLSDGITINAEETDTTPDSWSLISGTGNSILMYFNVSGKDNIYAWADVNAPGGGGNVELSPIAWLR